MSRSVSRTFNLSSDIWLLATRLSHYAHTQTPGKAGDDHDQLRRFDRLGQMPLENRPPSAHPVHTSGVGSQPPAGGLPPPPPPPTPPCCPHPHHNSPPPPPCPHPEQ